MKKSKLGAAILMAITVVGVTGCATGNYSANNYNGAQAMGAMMVKEGVVIGVRNVKIKPQDTGTGTAAGAGLGGIAGSNAGSGYRSGLAGAIVGAVVGGVAGHIAEGKLNTQDGLEITVKLDKSGDEIAVTQGADVQFKVGDHVRVLTDQRTGTTRVTQAQG